MITNEACHLIFNKRQWNNCYQNISEILLDLADFALQEQPEDNLMVAVFLAWYNGSYHIPRLSLNKTSTVIGWFLVTCPWSNTNVSRPGYNSAVVALSVVCLFVLLWLFRGKYIITKHLMYGSFGKLVSFVFPRILNQHSRENKTNCFPRDHTLSA